MKWRRALRLVALSEQLTAGESVLLAAILSLLLWWATWQVGAAIVEATMAAFGIPVS